MSLQKHSDELEENDVLVIPEFVYIIPIHVSPSFLVHRFDRMVTAFSCLITNMYCIVLSPSLLKPSQLDFKLFQIRINPHCMVYLGTMTPFKDIGLYARATMGGHARVYRVFGGVYVASYWSLKTEEGVAKIHNDLYVFADTINDSVLENPLCRPSVIIICLHPLRKQKMYLPPRR